MRIRNATDADLPLLADLNRQLIRDQGVESALSPSEIEERMREWLATGHEAVVFETGPALLGYALFATREGGVLLRQFFISPAHRRRGFGLQAVKLLRSRIFPTGASVTVELLARSDPALKFCRAAGFPDASVVVGAQD